MSFPFKLGLKFVLLIFYFYTMFLIYVRFVPKYNHTSDCLSREIININPCSQISDLEFYSILKLLIKV